MHIPFIHFTKRLRINTVIRIRVDIIAKHFGHLLLSDIPGIRIEMTDDLFEILEFVLLGDHISSDGSTTLRWRGFEIVSGLRFIRSRDYSSLTIWIPSTKRNRDE